MNKDEKIQAIKPLKSEFNKLSKKFDRILRYPDSDMGKIKVNRMKKMFILIAKMAVIHNQISMILHTPSYPAGGIELVEPKNIGEMIIKRSQAKANL